MENKNKEISPSNVENEEGFERVKTFDSTEYSSNPKLNLSIDPEKQRYPYSIVWTPIPLITYLIPFIGHTGICTSKGIVHDFAGSFYIGEDEMAFGAPHKYVQLDLTEEERDKWDQSIIAADGKYLKMSHNLFTNNCHSHVAHALNVLNYKGRRTYTMFSVFLMVTFKRKYVSLLCFIKTYLPFCILLCIILLISKLGK
ncbi:MAG: TMEM222 family protein [archaeon]|nr:TMEM222 family protein [archaeon]